MATADDGSIIGDEDAASQTSTELYNDHKPFETFQHKAIALCHELWPGHDEKDFTINRMSGGSDNRIVGIKISTKSNYVESPIEAIANNHNHNQASIPTGDYVLRIPRWKKENFDHTRAILQLAELYLKSSALKVPAVVHFDKNVTNVLGQPYILQERLRGSRLDELWDSLNKFQREQIAFELGRLYWSLQTATNSSGGIPDLSVSRSPDGSIQTFDFPFPLEDIGTRRYIQPQPPEALVLEKIERWNRLQVPAESPWPGISEMVKSRHPTFESADSKYYFCHDDLFPRNIMVEIIDERIATITGILDWDSAHFAPAIIAFAPPAWLWVKDYWADDDQGISEEELWGIANELLSDPESQIVKSIFDRWLSVQVLEIAYWRHARWARKIWACINDPRVKSWIYRELLDMYKAWKVSSDDYVMVDDDDGFNLSQG